MLKSLSPSERAKFFAAFYASQLVESGMRVGLGTGSTAAWLVRVLAARRSLEKLDILTVTTSTQTESQALDLGIPTTTLDETRALDLTIDGADEISEDLALTASPLTQDHTRRQPVTLEIAVTPNAYIQHDLACHS